MIMIAFDALISYEAKENTSEKVLLNFVLKGCAILQKVIWL